MLARADALAALRIPLTPFVHKLLARDEKLYAYTAVYIWRQHYPASLLWEYVNSLIRPESGWFLHEHLAEVANRCFPDIVCDDEEDGEDGDDEEE